MRFHAVAEQDIGALPAPVFAIILARSPRGVVVVLNSVRKVWELPGGFIDRGETPREAAVRELAEEAGCVARDVRWLGLVEVDDDGTRFGALLCCEVDTVPTDFTSHETLGVDLWRDDHQPRPAGASDEWLLRKFAAT